MRMLQDTSHICPLPTGAPRHGPFRGQRDRSAPRWGAPSRGGSGTAPEARPQAWYSLLGRPRETHTRGRVRLTAGERGHRRGNDVSVPL